ncbi:MAG: cobalamin biosynthesis protein [Rhodospirillaceae bacterium]|nr:cobalamin biosynthesis protein [Rhodospirillaceae bacterium]
MISWTVAPWPGSFAVLAAAILIDALAGEPGWLWRRVPHPIVLLGRLVGLLDRGLNREGWGGARRRAAGIACLVCLLSASIAAGWLLGTVAQLMPVGAVIEAVVVAILLAGRSLYDHVAAVAAGLRTGGLAGGRAAVARIVGRDPDSLDAGGVARAAIESCAENFSDGVIAPAFWYLVGGLPGIVAYKAVNTADSMIGHRSPRYRQFGWAAARFDDLVNLVPARLAGLLVALAAALRPGASGRGAVRAMLRDAGRHRSPNAGWPEAAMAGALGLALAGPRRYGGQVVDDHWMNAGGRQDAGAGDIQAAARLMAVATLLTAMTAGLAAVATYL